jgi:hypothetical protein
MKKILTNLLFLCCLRPPTFSQAMEGSMNTLLGYLQQHHANFWTMGRLYSRCIMKVYFAISNKHNANANAICEQGEGWLTGQEWLGYAYEERGYTYLRIPPSKMIIHLHLGATIREYFDDAQYISHCILLYFSLALYLHCSIGDRETKRCAC